MFLLLLFPISDTTREELEELQPSSKFLLSLHVDFEGFPLVSIRLPIFTQYKLLFDINLHSKSLCAPTSSLLKCNFELFYVIS